MSHPDDGALQEFLDGELGQLEAETLTAHVAACAACSTRLDDMRTMMHEAASLVERLQPGAPSSRRAAPPGRRRFSMQHLGVAAGLLVAVTAGLLWEAERRDVRTGSAVEPRTTARQPETPARQEAAEPVERPGGDTFRLRAGGQAGASAEAEAGPSLGTRAANEAASAESPRADAPAPVAAPPVPAAGLGEGRMAAADQAIRQEAQVADTPPGPAPTTGRKMKIEGDLPKPVPRTLGSSVNVVPRRLEGVTRTRLDTLPGVFRSTYKLGNQVVVLEESARPLPGNAAGQDAENQPGAEYRWEVRGAWLRLSGPLTRDSLAVLSTRVR